MTETARADHDDYLEGGPVLGVVIPTVAGGQRLHEALAALEVSAGGAPLDIVVVADGPGVPGLGELPAGARVIELDGNRGFAAAVNAGERALRASGWLALVNDDVLVDPGWYHALSLATLGPAVGAIASDVRFDPDRDRVNSRGVGMSRAGWFHDIQGGLPASSPPPGRDVLGPAGSLAVYRRAAWSEVGGMDERFFAFAEDVDLAWRLAARGWTTVFRAGAVGYHAHGMSFGQRSRHKTYLASRNRSVFRAKRLGVRERLRHLSGEFVREALLFVRDVRHGNGRAFIAGKRDALLMSRDAARAGASYRGRSVPVSPDTLAQAVRRKRTTDAAARGR
jgi:GT2 family glycosyltransferase